MIKVLFSKTTFYNSESLKNKFNIKKTSLSDNELLSHAYWIMGNSFVSHLDGDFSFVLYDFEQKHYFCARDPLGVKSLYYTKTQEEYHFSSNINDFFSLPHVPKKPNLNSMRTMLYQRTVNYTDTMYENIYRLPPGHFMTIKNGKEYIERYWYPENIKIDYDITEEEGAQKLFELLAKAVKKRVMKLEKTAFEVSGGLDSSSIVSLVAQESIPSSIDSYSMDFEGLKCDESTYVDSILEKYSLHHQKIPTSKLDYHQRYSLEYLYNLSPNWPITLTFAMSLPMFEKMKQDRKEIVITGQGGDHLFTGTRYALYDLFKRFKFINVYIELKNYVHPWNTIKSYIFAPLLGKRGTLFVKKLLRKNKEKIIDPFFEEDKDIKDLSEVLNIKNVAIKDDFHCITSAWHSTIMDGNIFHCAEDYFNLELRHPFFDKELVEFSLSLPPELKYKHRTIKWILRKAMNGILPNKIRDRKDKAEFSEIIIQQINGIDIDFLLDDPYIVKLGLIEQSLINKYRKEYEDKTIKYIIIFWTIINVEYWYRYNFENK